MDRFAFKVKKCFLFLKLLLFNDDQELLECCKIDNYNISRKESSNAKLIKEEDELVNEAIVKIPFT